MYAFWQIIATTPWWAYLLLMYIVNIGFAARRPRYLHYNQLIIAPSVLTTLFLLTFYHLLPWQLVYLAVWGAMIPLGAVLGWLQYKHLKIKAIRHTAKLYIPGTWSVLIIMVLLFSLKYYLGLKISFDATTLQQPKYIWSLVTAYGLFTGLFLGRAFYAQRCLQMGPFEE